MTVHLERAADTPKLAFMKRFIAKLVVLSHSNISKMSTSNHWVCAAGKNRGCLIW